MNEPTNFTRKSFLQRVVISQFLLVAVVGVIITVAGDHGAPPGKIDTEKLAAKLISAKTTGTQVRK